MTASINRSTATNRLARACRTLVAATLLTTGAMGYMLPALADGTEAGTEIKNTAVGTFQNATNLAAPEVTVTSNEVIVTVAEIAGITAVSAGTPTEAPANVTNAGPTQGDGSITPEDVVYYDFTITNVGNDATQFFVPGTPSDIQRNGTTNDGGVLQGNIQIIGYNPDGDAANAVDLSSAPVTVGATGIATGETAALGANGSFAPGGTITVRVPVKLDSDLVANDVIKVILGNTAPNDDSAATQNQDYVNDGSDLYTQDNAGTDNDDIDGAPSNGDATSHRKEASATEEVTVNIAPRDYGDLPAPYASSEAEGGPSHFVRKDGAGADDLFIGDGITDEADAVTTNGDGSDDDNDDALTITAGGTTASFQGLSFLQGETITLDTVDTTGAGNLSIWIDWNQDGTFDADEQIVSDQAPTNDAITLPNITVPVDTAAGNVGVLVRYSESTGVGPTAIGGYGEVETYQITVGESQPALTLVKRVTSVAGTAITTFTDDGTPNNEDNDPNWPANYLAGTIDTSTAAPGDEIEYTVYFLSSGNDAITNLNICDMVPEKTTYQTGTDSIQLSFNGASTTFTNAPGDDKGEFSATVPSGPGITCPTDNGNGGILVKVVESPDVVENATAAGTPNNSFGFVRFKVTVD